MKDICWTLHSRFMLCQSLQAMDGVNKFWETSITASLLATEVEDRVFVGGMSEPNEAQIHQHLFVLEEP